MHFSILDEALADARILAAADQAGTLYRAGNWTPGQIFGHLATWIDYAFDGTPLNIPWVIRIALRPMKNRFLNRPMRPGAKIPRIKDGTLAMDVLPTDEGFAKLEGAIGRLKVSAPTAPHPVFGKMTHDEWIKMHLRHAELHLGCLKVGD